MWLGIQAGMSLTSRSLPCPFLLQISAGQMHSAAVSSSGDAFLWGYGKFHQLGFGDDHDRETLTPLPPLKGNTVAVACGSLHSLALQYGGDVLSWGANQVG
jgi:alpha-tubulin suppressor-like RCC1 family protein